MEVQDTPELEPEQDTPETEPEQTESLLGDEEQTPDESTEVEQPKYSVKLDGTEVEVPLDELLKGYQRQADYTAKTMALAARDRELAEKSQQVETARQQEMSRLTTAVQAAQAALAYDVQNIDWDDLLRNNPQEYLVKQRQIQQRNAQIQSAIAEHSRLQQEESQKREYELRTTVERESAQLANLVPEWKDEAKRAADQAEIRRWALSQGYPEETLNSVSKARDVLTLRKAMLYDKMASKVPAARPPSSAPPPPPPAPTKAKAAPNPDKMTMTEWLKWREAQLRRKG